jgi:hypothetical protein
MIDDSLRLRDTVFDLYQKVYELLPNKHAAFTMRTLTGLTLGETDFGRPIGEFSGLAPSASEGSGAAVQLLISYT